MLVSPAAAPFPLAVAQSPQLRQGAAANVKHILAGEEPVEFLDCLNTPSEKRCSEGNGWVGATEVLPPCVQEWFHHDIPSEILYVLKGAVNSPEQARCAAYDDAFEMFQSGRRSDIARKGGEGAAELERAAAATQAQGSSSVPKSVEQAPRIGDEQLSSFPEASAGQFLRASLHVSTADEIMGEASDTGPSSAARFRGSSAVCMGVDPSSHFIGCHA